MKPTIISCLVPLLTIFCLNSLQAQTKLENNSASISSKIDSIFSEWDGSDTPGASVLVLHNDEVVYQKAFGMVKL